MIYGEPQSGKTEMMIALTARLLDEGARIIVVLMNDSVQLLEQNLDRFLRSGLDPAPKKFNELLDPTIDLKSGTWVIFCKKNSADLQKLIAKLGKHHWTEGDRRRSGLRDPELESQPEREDEDQRARRKLLGKDGIYIGVTATPARLDLNNTFDNQNEHWIDFPRIRSTPARTRSSRPRPPASQLPFRLSYLPLRATTRNICRSALLAS